MDRFTVVSVLLHPPGQGRALDRGVVAMYRGFGAIREAGSEPGNGRRANE